VEDKLLFDEVAGKTLVSWQYEKSQDYKIT
jgi:hypothetical protein